MEEFDNVAKVRLKTNDGRIMFPQTSADLVLGLEDAVKAVVAPITAEADGNSVILKTGETGSVRIEAGDGIRVEYSGGTVRISSTESPEETKVKVYSDETAQGWLSFADDGSLKPGMLFEEL